ncbi:11995_t:CDS:2 [Ambispora gerdemannii]|uniref:11995_t:CDS:1 n=1 Tax=Ambispora gerdemannii TaxID=144530 RepID=A0A9N8VZC0_9GLOM|nr:11995_t:CDS:2 [Ambispora gerdemannii]
MTSKEEWFDKATSDDGKIRKIPYEDISKGELIGDGSFGKVYLAKCNSIAENIVLKKIKKCHIKGKDSFYGFIKELKIHSNLNHTSIIHLYGISEKKHDTLNWTKKISLAKQMADGIHYLHSHDIIHRDLHSKNILLRDDQIKIADFGLSKDVNSKPSSASENLGATPYTEPKTLEHEIIEGLREDPLPDTPVKYMELYQHCWKLEPEDRPSIQEICKRAPTAFMLFRIKYLEGLLRVGVNCRMRIVSRMASAAWKRQPEFIKCGQRRRPQQQMVNTVSIGLDVYQTPASNTQIFVNDPMSIKFIYLQVD